MRGLVRISRYRNPTKSRARHKLIFYDMACTAPTGMFRSVRAGGSGYAFHRALLPPIEIAPIHAPQSTCTYSAALMFISPQT